MQSRISVGNFSYDASELRGTNATRLVSSHIETLTELGSESKIRSSNNLRYGEIEEDLYSDVVCEGGLAFSARILNASDHRKEFRAADFAAQVGNGIVTGSRRQRVTMVVPNAFTVIKGAVKEGVSIDRDVSLAEETGFSSVSYFFRLFRRFYGMTPQVYRTGAGKSACGDSKD